MKIYTLWENDKEINYTFTSIELNKELARQKNNMQIGGMMNIKIKRLG